MNIPPQVSSLSFWKASIFSYYKQKMLLLVFLYISAIWCLVMELPGYKIQISVLKTSAKLLSKVGVPTYISYIQDNSTGKDTITALFMLLLLLISRYYSFIKKNEIRIHQPLKTWTLKAKLFNLIVMQSSLQRIITILKILGKKIILVQLCLLCLIYLTLFFLWISAHSRSVWFNLLWPLPLLSSEGPLQQCSHLTKTASPQTPSIFTMTQPCLSSYPSPEAAQISWSIIIITPLKALLSLLSFLSRGYLFHKTPKPSWIQLFPFSVNLNSLKVMTMILSKALNRD